MADSKSLRELVDDWRMARVEVQVQETLLEAAPGSLEEHLLAIRVSCLMRSRRNLQEIEAQMHEAAAQIRRPPP